jgi:hypothetical protein
MSHTSAIPILFCALLFSAIPLPAGHGLSGLPQKTKAATGSATAKPKIDVCALLISAEIEAVQGEPVKETKPGVQPSGGILMSQCLFLMATPAKSVTLMLATTDPARPSALRPRQFWQQQFHPPGLRKKEMRAGDNTANKSKRESEESKPRLISGLGEEAYWVGSPVAGALYVLQGETFLRISVGGVRAESARIEKSKTLARAILKRL